MDPRAQGALMLAIGGVAVRLGLTGSALNYIKSSYVPLLVLAGAVVAVLGGITLFRALRQIDDLEDQADAEQAHDHDAEGQDVADTHGHDHSRGPSIAWMLAAPLFAILLIAPPPLGSFAANRQSGVVQSSVSVWPPLPPAEDGAVPLTLGDYSSRALYDTDLSLAGSRVRLSGFVSDTSDQGFVLTRFALSCCAADGTAINVEVITDQPPPAIDEWVEVEGTWRNRDDHVVGELTTEPPLIEADAVRTIPQPDQPYET